MPLVSLVGPGSRLYQASQAFNPGNLTFFDDFDYSVTRSQSIASKITTFQAAGWNQLKDFTGDGGAAAGWFYTRTAAQAAADLGYAGGAFPGSVDRCLVVEAQPSIGDIQDAPANTWRQTDFYLEHLLFPTRVYWRYWQYIIPGGTTSPGNKLWYPHITGEAHTTAPYIVIDGWRNTEHQNTFRSSGERTDFENGDVPHDDWLIELQAAGTSWGSETNDSRVANTNMTEPPRTETPQNLSTSTVIEPGGWYEITLFCDLTNPQGSYGYWVRPYGGSRVQVAGFTGGVTSGYSWPCSAALQAETNLILRWPTTMNWYSTYGAYDTSDEGDHIRLIQDLGWASEWADLWTAPDEP